MCCITKISNVCFVKCRRLESSFRPFYDFNEMTIQGDLLIVSSLYYLPFLILLYSPIQKRKHCKFYLYNCLLSNWSRLLNWKGPGTLPTVLHMLEKISEKYCHCLYLSIEQVWGVNELWFKRYIQKCTLSHVPLIMMSQILKI